MYLPPGTELNHRYVIESLLGHGGFGITYAARDKTLNVRVAIKEYLPRQLATRGEGRTKVSIFTGEARQHFDYGLRKFLEEAQSVARFAHHPNVVSARDYFAANGTAYIVMEYVEGVTLKEYLEKKGGRISFEEARGIMMPVMDALREVHQAGMLHRDISPENIYITTLAQVKVLDFGAARYFSGEQSKSLSVILKPGYAPEEQYRSSGKQGAWTDVYAVGATIYKALTAQAPPDALDRMAGDTLMPPSRLGAAIPPGAEKALLQALAVNAGQRFQTMGAFQQALAGGAPMPGKFQPSPGPVQPAPEPDHASAPGSAPLPVSSQPAQPSPQARLFRRPANPAAVAVGIVAGVLGLIIVMILIMGVLLPTLATLLFNPKQVEQHKAEDQPWIIAKKLRDQGQRYLNSGELDQARTALDKAKSLNPDSNLQFQLAEDFYQLGLAYDRQDQTGLAIASLEDSVRLRPKHAITLQRLGLAYGKLNRYKDSVETLEKAVGLEPNRPYLHYCLGVAYLRSGNKEKAWKEHRILEKLDKKSAKDLKTMIDRG